MAVNEARYVPDLTGMMAECEANYARLLKLLPELLSQHRARELKVSWPNGQVVTVRLEVLENFPYTTTVRISQRAVSQWLHLPSMVVRLYHDASMAEVVDARHMRQLKGVYVYPNEQMHHADEKVQRNSYLGEWLCYCLRHGHTAEEISLVGA